MCTQSYMHLGRDTCIPREMGISIWGNMLQRGSFTFTGQWFWGSNGHSYPSSSSEPCSGYVNLIFQTISCWAAVTLREISTQKIPSLLSVPLYKSLPLLKWTEEFHWSKSAFTYQNAHEFATHFTSTAHVPINTHRKRCSQHKLI